MVRRGPYRHSASSGHEPGGSVLRKAGPLREVSGLNSFRCSDPTGAALFFLYSLGTATEDPSVSLCENVMMNVLRLDLRFQLDLDCSDSKFARPACAASGAMRDIRIRSFLAGERSRGCGKLEGGLITKSSSPRFYSVLIRIRILFPAGQISGT